MAEPTEDSSSAQVADNPAATNQVPAETPSATHEQILNWIETKEFTKVVSAIKAEQLATGKSSEWHESTLATAQFLSKDFGGAVIHAQNAILINRWNAEARNNLSVAQAAVENGLGQSMSHPADWGFALSSWIRPKESLSVSFLFLNVFLLLRFFRKPNFKRDLGLGFLLIILLSLSAVGFYGDSIGVIKQNTTLKRQPVSSSSEAGTLPAGARVRQIRTSGAFAEIERSGAPSYRGWIPKESLKLFY